MTTAETKARKLLMLAKELAPKRGGRPKKKNQKTETKL